MNGRKFVRTNCSIDASIMYGDSVVTCKTHNLSLRGMYLKTKYSIPLNTPVNVTVYNSMQPPIKISGKVVRKEASGVCLEISNMNSKTFAQLRDIVLSKVMMPA
jgi:hypothetical protein